MRRFILFLVIFLGILFLLLALVFFFKDSSPSFPGKSAKEEPGDTIPPSTAIVSPEDNSWQNTGFLVAIRDSDLGEGFVDYLPEKQGCRYIIQDLGTDTAAGGFRPCGIAEIFVPVGENKVCSSSFAAESSQGKCMVSSKAIDQAGNESSWKSIVAWVDLDAPLVGRISLPVSVLPGEKLIFDTSVSDSGKIVGCELLVDGEQLPVEVSLTPLPCKNSDECSISASYAFSAPGDYEASFACVDSAENVGIGEPSFFRVFENKAPEITQCRVLPTKGKIATEFLFAVEASDPEGDPLSFRWEFDDTSWSEERSPVHHYSNTGTFRPRVIVRDPSGEQTFCSTAWVVVE